MADRYFDYGAKFYESPEEYAARVANVNSMFRPAALGQVPVEPMRVGNMIRTVTPPTIRPLGSPAGVPPMAPEQTSQPLATLPSNPLLDPSLYSPVPRRIQQPFDFTQFRYPEAPQFRMPGMAPTRNLAEEQGYTRRVSLKAALLGALLGGGTGAIAGLTGAQQGAQQSFEQDYAQRMADYQNQARLMDIENQQLASADQRAIAMRNAQMQDALRAYDVQGQRMQVEDENARAEQAARLAQARAMAEGRTDDAKRISDALKASLDYIEEDRPAYLRAALTGQVPTTALRPMPKEVTSTTGSMASQMARDLIGISSRITDADYANRRTLMINNPDPNIRMAGLLLPEARPKTAATLPAASLEERVAAGKRKETREDRLVALREKAEKRIAGYQQDRLAIDRDRLALQRTRESRLAKPKVNGKTPAPNSTEISAIRKSFESIVKLIAKGVEDARKPEFVYVQKTRDQLNQDMAGLRQQLRDMEANYAGIIKIDNIESGLPTLRILGQGSPRPGNPPAGGTTPPAPPGRNRVERIINGVRMVIEQ